MTRLAPGALGALLAAGSVLQATAGAALAASPVVAGPLVGAVTPTSGRIWVATDASSTTTSTTAAVAGAGATAGATSGAATAGPGAAVAPDGGPALDDG